MRIKLKQLHQPIAIDEKDTDGHTALMWAAYQGDAISVDLLLRHGASTVSRDNNGLTPLHCAAVKGSSACVQHLIEHGADLETRDAAGKSPRDMAEELRSIVPYEKGLLAATSVKPQVSSLPCFADSARDNICDSDNRPPLSLLVL